MCSTHERGIAIADSTAYTDEDFVVGLAAAHEVVTLSRLANPEREAWVLSARRSVVLTDCKAGLRILVEKECYDQIVLLIATVVELATQATPGSCSDGAPTQSCGRHRRAADGQSRAWTPERACSLSRLWEASTS